MWPTACSEAAQQVRDGQADAARATYRDALARGERGVELAPDGNYHRERLAQAYDAAAQLAHLKQDLAAAIDLSRRAVAHQRDLVKLQGELAQVHANLATYLNHAGIFLWDKGALAEALPVLEEAVRVQEGVMAQLKGDRRALEQLRHQRGCVGKVLGELGDYRRAAAVIIQAGETLPDGALERFKSATFLLFLCVPQAQKDKSLTEEQRRDLVRRYTEQAVAFRDAALKVCPDTPTARSELALWLALHRADQLRDPVAAMRLACAAVEQAPQEPACWSALGAAHYARGEYAEAVEALTKAERLRQQFDSGDGFLRALCHARLGDGSAAEWYDRAVKEKAHSAWHEGLLGSVEGQARRACGR
jgi:tetratricopeptide (TPR) repeat protein